eukprot:scaffold2284_cov402-Prasinococcus_capsulatus_cf.AAC.3
MDTRCAVDNGQGPSRPMAPRRPRHVPRWPPSVGDAWRRRSAPLPRAGHPIVTRILVSSATKNTLSGGTRNRLVSSTRSREFPGQRDFPMRTVNDYGWPSASRLESQGNNPVSYMMENAIVQRISVLHVLE